MMCAHSPPLAADAPGVVYALVAIVCVWQVAIARVWYRREAQ
jgi:hypothetical protein